MYAHEYGLKHFKHKTNFHNLVAFSDVQQNMIKDTESPSSNIYLEIEKGVVTTDKWLIHFNSRLSGEYGDFFLENNPPFGTTNALQYEETDESYAFIQNNIDDFNDETIPYYQINEKFYIQIDNSINLEEVIVQANPSPKPRPAKSVEYDAFVTVFVSDNGAKLERAYQKITDVNAHQVVIFIESGGGTNAFGTVFRIRKGKNVKTVPEVDRITVAQVARAFGVSLASNELSTMIQEELKDDDSYFYFLLSKVVTPAGKIIRWGSSEVLTGVSGLLKDASKGINELKLGENYWKTEVDGKENPKFNPLLPRLKNEKTGLDVEAFIKTIYKTYIAPLTQKATSVVKGVLENKIVAKLVPFNLEVVIKTLDEIPALLQNFFNLVIDYLADLYYFINGLLVGLINSIIDFVKSIFDILAMLFDVLNGTIQSTKFFESPGTYLSLFAEVFENMIDAFVNAFTFENLKKFISLLASLPKLGYAAIVSLVNGVSNINIDPGAVGYYLGFMVGFVASEVALFFATGGTGTIAKGVTSVLKSYKALATIPAKVIANGAKIVQKSFSFGLDAFLRAIEGIASFAKNLPKHLDTLKGLINEFIASLKSKAVLIDNVAFSVVDPITAFANTVFKIFKANSWKKLNELGVSILKSEEGIYTFLYNGKNIAEKLTKSQAEEFLKEIFVKSKGKTDDVVKKYLDEVEKFVKNEKLRKESFARWFSKFEKKFHIHFDGELKLERLSRRDGTMILRGTGGHNHLVIGDNIRIRRFLTEPIDDKPFDALISIRYRNGQWIDKRAKSSMFPKNWSEERVKEEIALVYDKMIEEGFELRFPNNKYTSKINTDFEITIEVDNLGDLTNAYPKLN